MKGGTAPVIVDRQAAFVSPLVSFVKAFEADEIFPLAHARDAHRAGPHLADGALARNPSAV